MPGILDPATFRRGMEIFADQLRLHRDQIDSLNVYPVPDGDTGTNMLMTQEAVVAAVRSIPVTARTEDLGTTVSRAALLGARGNSGVILSQILRGMCERLPSSGAFVPTELAAALDHAAREARRAVGRPVEGTILSVLGDAARAAGESAAADPTGDIASVLQAALDEARRSLARTTERLPELKNAGVVDAGGKGVVLFLDALHAAIQGEAPSEPVGTMGPVGHPSGYGAPRVIDPDLDGIGQHEVQYLLEAEEIAIAPMRAALADIGDSLVVVGGGGLYSVHVHTNDPDRALEAGSRAGEVRDVRVASLRDQMTGCLTSQARAVRLAEEVCSLVAVAEGDGLSRTFRSLGAAVVRGSPGRNPSVDDLAATIAACSTDAVVVLPNQPNVAPLAELAAAQTSKDVRVVPVASIPAGLSAATVFNPLATLQENAKVMEEAARACRSGEILRAGREAETPAGGVGGGQWLGIADGEVVAAGAEPAAVATELVRGLAPETAEVLTIVVGADAEAADVRSVEAEVRRTFPSLELEIVEGDQPEHPFLIGVE